MRCHEMSWDKVFEKAKKSFTDKSRITLKCGTNGKKRNNCATGIYWIGYDTVGCTSSVLGECTTGANHVHERPSVWLGFCDNSLYESVYHRLQWLWTERMRGHKILGNAHSNAAINVQNQVCSLASGNLFLGYRSQRPLTVLEIRVLGNCVCPTPSYIAKVPLRGHSPALVWF